jgi:hypothetical protein
MKARWKGKETTPKKFEPFTVEVTFETLPETARMWAWLDLVMETQIELLKTHHGTVNLPQWKLAILDEAYEIHEESDDLPFFAVVHEYLTEKGYIPRKIFPWAETKEEEES